MEEDKTDFFIIISHFATWFIFFLFETTTTTLGLARTKRRGTPRIRLPEEERRKRRTKWWSWCQIATMRTRRSAHIIIIGQRMLKMPRITTLLLLIMMGNKINRTRPRTNARRDRTIWAAPRITTITRTNTGDCKKKSYSCERATRS